MEISDSIGGPDLTGYYVNDPDPRVGSVLHSSVLAMVKTDFEEWRRQYPEEDKLTGAFAVSSPYAWDVSNLYTTGQVTLTVVPEPTSSILMIPAAFGWSLRRRRAA